MSNGGRYDLDTAHEVVIIAHGFRGSHSYYIERLLRKKNGLYVLHGRGNILSPYHGGERFINMTYKEAREWGRREMGKRDFEKEFGKRY